MNFNILYFFVGNCNKPKILLIWYDLWVEFKHAANKLLFSRLACKSFPDNFFLLLNLTVYSITKKIQPKGTTKKKHITLSLISQPLVHTTTSCLNPFETSQHTFACAAKIFLHKITIDLIV